MVNKISFLFPGQGSQSIGMAKNLYDQYDVARKIINDADKILGFSLSKIMFEGPEEQLKDTSITQPALFVSSAAAFEVLMEKGISAEVMAGHSLGEYSALYAAEVISYENALKLVRARGVAMNEAGKSNSGTMAAIIGLEKNKLQEICADVTSRVGICALANINSSSQIVISGQKEAVLEAMTLAKTAGAAKVIELNVSGAFHSSLMKSAADKMAEELDKVSFYDTSTPVVTNVDAQLTRNGKDFKRKLIDQICQGVLWHDTMHTIASLSPDFFIEVGSGKVLSTMAKKFDRNKTCLCTDEIGEIDQVFASLLSQ
ncbi:MAG: ACP S-malonyltransferase [Elusimicrobiota bacterium]